MKYAFAALPEKGGIINVSGVANLFVWASQYNDTIGLGDGAHIIYGRAGMDFISVGHVLNPNDGSFVFGGDDGDIIQAGYGSHRLFGENGADSLNAWNGGTHIVMWGGTGNDSLNCWNNFGELVEMNGGADADWIGYQGFGKATINCGTGNDTVWTVGASNITLGLGADIVGIGIPVAPGTHFIINDFTPDYSNPFAGDRLDFSQYGTWTVYEAEQKTVFDAYGLDQMARDSDGNLLIANGTVVEGTHFTGDYTLQKAVDADVMILGVDQVYYWNPDGGGKGIMLG